MATATSSATPSREDFAKLLEESFTHGGSPALSKRVRRELERSSRCEQAACVNACFRNLDPQPASASRRATCPPRSSRLSSYLCNVVNERCRLKRCTARTSPLVRSSAWVMAA